MTYGRKFWVTAFGLAGVILTAVAAVMRGEPLPPHTLETILGLVASFHAGNVGATFAHKPPAQPEPAPLATREADFEATP